jgi:hypothetical protein
MSPIFERAELSFARGSGGSFCEALKHADVAGLVSGATGCGTDWFCPMGY